MNKLVKRASTVTEIMKNNFTLLVLFSLNFRRFSKKDSEKNYPQSQD